MQNQLQAVLDDLESTGCLQHVNRMDIEGLLNSAEESVIIDNATDQEIYEAVMASHNAQEDILINGGDDDIDDDCLSEPYPTYKEVLAAISTLKKHIDLDSGPCARKLDDILDPFRYNPHREHSNPMKPTLVTDYFRRISS
jgi:hypothetical protein